jgi:hypothetical protein
MRYFRSTPAVYAVICAQLDAAYGYPDAATKTERALPLVQELPTDAQSRVYLGLESELCYYILPSEILPELLDSGAVEEIDEGTYRSVAHSPPERR